MNIVILSSCVLLCFSAASCHSQRKSENVIVANEGRNLMIIINDIASRGEEIPHNLSDLDEIYNERLSASVDLKRWIRIDSGGSYVLLHKKIIDGKLIIGIPPGDIKLIEME